MDSIMVSGLTGLPFISFFFPLCTKERQLALGMAVLSVPRLLCFSLRSAPPGALCPSQVCELGCLLRPEVSYLVWSPVILHSMLSGPPDL